jgi:hypothetical protein
MRGRANTERAVTKQLGVAIDAREIRAVWLRHGTPSWHARAPLRNARSIAEAFETLFATLPRPLKRARVSIALSPAWVQVKALNGLPPIKRTHVLNQLLRENQRAFFLWKGAQYVVVDVDIHPDGEVWGASFDKEMLDEVAQCLRGRRMRLGRVVPAVSAIGAILPRQVVRWRADDAVFEIQTGENGLTRIERPAEAVGQDPGSLPQSLRNLGLDGAHFLDAFAAAVAPRRLPLTFRPQSDAARLRIWSRVVHATMGLALAGTAGLAAFAPGLRASAFVRDSRMELSGARETQSEFAQNQAELRRVTQTLARIASFDAQRGAIPRILGALSQAIPESTAFLTFHVDSAEGSFVAIAPHVADVLPELVSVEEVSGPRIVGSVTREVIGGARVERAAFRFRRARPPTAKPRPPR